MLALTGRCTASAAYETGILCPTIRLLVTNRRNSSLDTEPWATDALCCRDGKIFGLTMRVGRAITGSADLAADVVRNGSSILLLGESLWNSSIRLRAGLNLTCDVPQMMLQTLPCQTTLAWSTGRPGVGKSKRHQHMEKNSACIHESIHTLVPSERKIAQPKPIASMSTARVTAGTSLRDCARILAEECRRRVIIVDTSNEIGGDGDIPHPSIANARRMQVGCLPVARPRNESTTGQAAQMELRESALSYTRQTVT